MDKLGIVFSGRFKSALLCLLGAAILLQLTSMCWQLFGAYVAGGGFDVSIHDFWVIMIVFFLPYFLAAAYMLRSLAARIALYRLLKRQIVIAEYRPPASMQAGIAGLMIDNTFGLPEIAATLTELELDGYIAIDTSLVTPQFRLLKTTGLQEPYRSFVQTLFAGSSQLVITYETRSLLLSAGTKLGDAFRAEMRANGQLRLQSSLTPAFRFVFKIFLCIALVVVSVWGYALITNPGGLFSINYPRYLMNMAELIGMTALVIITILVSASGFWQRTLTNDRGIKDWRYVAGLKTYIDIVYRNRFRSSPAAHATPQELRDFYPYAVAFEIEPSLARRLQRALLLT